MSGSKERKACKECGKPAQSKGWAKDGTRRWGARCGACNKRAYMSDEAKRHRNRRAVQWQKDNSPRLLYLADACERCGFEPEHPWQLQLDHVDGNRGNNTPSNYQTLCANCHVLKTVRNGDWASPSSLPLRSLLEGAGQGILFDES